MKRFLLFLFILGFALSMFSCNQERTEDNNQPETGNKDKLPVMVSIIPQKYFLEKLGGDRVDITVLIPKGSSPHSYEPMPDDLKRVSKVKAYFTAGIEFEKAWMDRLKGVNDKMNVVDTTEGIEFATVLKGKTEEPSIDTHVWISPKLVKIQSENIYKGLSETDPENEEYYRENYENFLNEIDEIDKYIKDKLAGVENRKFMIFHPAWGYFAKDYDLEMIPIEIEGKEPSASELAALIDKAKENNIQIIFVSPSFSTKTAEVIADEIGGDVLFIGTLEENWSENLKKVADIFAKVMKGQE